MASGMGGCGVGVGAADGDAVGWGLAAIAAGGAPLHPIRLAAASVTAMVARVIRSSLARVGEMLVRTAGGARGQEELEWKPRRLRSWVRAGWAAPSPGGYRPLGARSPFGIGRGRELRA